jgi:hypothetical protein
MEDQEIAAFLRDQCRRRMSGADIALVELIADGHEVTASDLRHFQHLKTQFAADLAHAGKAVAR